MHGFCAAPEVQFLHYRLQPGHRYLSQLWGYPDAGYEASLKQRGMLESGAYDGRSTLGSIFTFSAGNYYTSDANVNQKGYQKSRYTIAIGAIGYSGAQSWYSSIGAPVLVVALEWRGPGITTADRTGRI